MASTKIAFDVSGEMLEVSSDLWLMLQGPKPPAGYSCDGCSHSPDRYISAIGRRIYKLWPACVIHDYHYREATVLTRDAAGRAEADRVLYENLLTCVRYYGGSNFDARRIAWLYWGRVRMWGASSFQHWAQGAKPVGWWRRLREVW